MKILRKIKTVNDLKGYLWELPQNILGLMVIIVLRPWYSVSWNDCYFTEKLKYAISLGTYTIAPREEYNNICVMWHERGHRLQSKKYGWLYLPVVFIPAAFRDLWDKVAHRKWSHWKREKWYYSGFPEKQADELGKLRRFEDD